MKLSNLLLSNQKTLQLKNIIAKLEKEVENLKSYNTESMAYSATNDEK